MATIQIVCAWCKTNLGSVPDPSGQGGVSHGMCETCANRMKAELAQRKKDGGK